MENTLYRIKPKIELEHPELSGPVMMTCDGGTLFAELQPVKIKAKAKEPCEFCALPQGAVCVFAYMPDGREVRSAQPPYCFNCGRKLLEE